MMESQNNCRRWHRSEHTKLVLVLHQECSCQSDGKPTFIFVIVLQIVSLSPMLLSSARQHFIVDLMKPSTLRQSFRGKHRCSFFANSQQYSIPSPANSQWYFGVNSIVTVQFSSDSLAARCWRLEEISFAKSGHWEYRKVSIHGLIDSFRLLLSSKDPFLLFHSSCSFQGWSTHRRCVSLCDVFRLLEDLSEHKTDSWFHLYHFLRSVGWS